MIQLPSPFLLTVLFVIVCIGDVWSTMIGLKAGGREFNTAGRGLFARLGVLGGATVLKIIGGAIVIFGIWYAPQYGLYYFAILIFGGVGVIGYNLFNAAG